MSAIAILLLAMFGYVVPALRGEVIDRIVAVVDKHIITLSDIRTERILREVLGEPTDKDDQNILDELIDQHMIHLQLEFVERVEPTVEEVAASMVQIQDRKGLSESVIRDAVLEHLE